MRNALQVIILALAVFHIGGAVRMILTLRGKPDRESRATLMLNFATLSAGAGLFAYILLTRLNEDVGNFLAASLFAVGALCLVRAEFLERG